MSTVGTNNKDKDTNSYQQVMTATDIEVDAYTIDVVPGTPQTDVPIATVNGAIKSVDIDRVDHGPDGEKYVITIIHDNVGTTALEFTYRNLAVTKGTPVTDGAFGAIAGTVVQSKATARDQGDNIVNYDLIAVHLNA